MELTQGFPTAPGACFTCRTNQGSLWSIDTRRDDTSAVRRENVYICGPCVRAMAKKLEPHVDWSVVADDLLDDLRSAGADRDELVERLEKAERVVRDLVAVLPEYITVAPA